MAELSTLAYLAGTAALQHAIGYFWTDKIPPKAERVGLVSCINLYPVKSMRRVEVEKATCTHRGLRVGQIWDRTWMVIHGERNQYISGRREPKLVTIETSIHGNYVQLEAPDHRPLRLPVNMQPNGNNNIVILRQMRKDVVGLDCGDAAAAWVCSVLGKPGYRLIHHVPALPNRHPETMKHWPHLWKAKAEDQINYHEGSPFTLLTDASMADLNRRLEEHASFKQFRQSIDVASLCPAYDEDMWHEVFIGETKFTNIGPVPRCKFTAVDPSTGELHPEKEPQTTLKSYRQVYPGYKMAPAFGRCLVLDKPGVIHVGDPVYAIRGPPLNEQDLL